MAINNKATEAARDTVTKLLNNPDNSKILSSFEGVSNIDFKSEISRELQRINKEQTTVTNCGMFVIKSANDTLKDAKNLPDPNPLWLSLWNEGEVCCLFADSNVGKSLYAVQIASSIAEKQPVLYFDFELSEKQFQLRYTSNEGVLHIFPDKFFRVEVDAGKLGTNDFEEQVIIDIEKAATEQGAKILIIDNLTWICNASEKGEAAGVFMQKLIALKKKYGFSILVLAHTPKRPMTSPIAQNDLAGSKKLFNFFDSAFSIGFSAKDSSLRYIKCVKIRTIGKDTIIYDSENVITASIEKEGSFTQFVTLGYCPERDHLKELTEYDQQQITEQVKEQVSKGVPYRTVASKLGISLAKVQRCLKK